MIAAAMQAASIRAPKIYSREFVSDISPNDFDRWEFFLLECFFFFLSFYDFDSKKEKYIEEKFSLTKPSTAKE